MVMNTNITMSEREDLSMEMFATLLCMFSMFAGIFFLITIIIRKIRKKPKKKLYSRGFLISVVVFIISIVLFAIFETPETRIEAEQRRLEQQEQEKAEVEKQVEGSDDKKQEETNDSHEEKKQTKSDVSSYDKFVKDVKKVIQGSVGENETITDVVYKDRDLCVYVDFSEADPTPITYEDLAISRTCSITDEILALTQYYDLWDTVTVDFGDLGYIRNGKENILDSEYGLYFDVETFELK